MTKCKIIEGFYYCDVEYEVNNFIKDKKVVSISMSECKNSTAVLILYEEEV